MNIDNKALVFSKPIDFHPGVDEWFTYNVYSGVNLLDNLLKQIYTGIVNLIENGTLKSFFFVRYRDPNFHLRLRFQLYTSKDIGKVTTFLSNYFAPYLLENIIWKTTITGYARETLRYGTLSIEIIEDIFAKSSLITLKKLLEISQRWNLAVIYLSVIFDFMDFSIEERGSFCKKVKELFFSEFNFNKQVKSNLRIKFSEYYDQLDGLLQSSGSPLYVDYKTELSHIFEKLKGLLHLYPSSAIDHILASIIHMEFNRIFINGAREKEAIIYYILDRYYARQINQRK